MKYHNIEVIGRLCTCKKKITHKGISIKSIVRFDFAKQQIQQY